MEEILNILDKEKGNVSRAKIAQMLGMEEKEVADKIEKMEKENVIVGYKTTERQVAAEGPDPSGDPGLCQGRAEPHAGATDGLSGAVRRPLQPGGHPRRVHHLPAGQA